jgi:hypothetical protein
MTGEADFLRGFFFLGGLGKWSEKLSISYVKRGENIPRRNIGLTNLIRLLAEDQNQSKPNEKYITPTKISENPTLPSHFLYISLSLSPMFPFSL